MEMNTSAEPSSPCFIMMKAGTAPCRHSSSILSGSLRRVPTFARCVANVIIKVIFSNSDGWNCMNPRLSQPMSSAPSTPRPSGVNSSSTSIRVMGA